MDNFSRTVIAIFGILLALPLCLVSGGTIQKEDSLALTSWMGSLPAATPISMLNIPGTHDSGADRGCPGPLFDRYAKCQDMSIHEQLEAGIRYLDIRCRRKGAAFQIYHGQCNQAKSFGDVLAECQEFLLSNPSEAILMRIKEEHKPKTGSSPFKEIFLSYTKEYLSENWFVGDFIPSLREVRGRIVLLDDADLGMGIPWGGIRKQDEYALRSYERKWDFVEEHLELARHSHFSSLLLNHCSATAFSSRPGRLFGATLGLVKSPRGFARNIIPRLEAYLKGEHGLARHGVVVMDFPSPEVIRLLVDSNQYLNQLN